MARIRTIKPEFPQSESMGRVSRDSRLLFIELWTLCDDSGRTRGNSRMLASLLFPYDDDAPEKIDGWIDELEKEGCIVRYIADGSTYIQVLNWLNHQKVDKPSPSKIPEFVESSRIVSNPRECSSVYQGVDQGSRTKDQGVEEKPKGATATRLPADWSMSVEDCEFCSTTRPDLNALETASRFRDYWIAQPGVKGRKTDWPATWRNWVRNEKKQQITSWQDKKQAADDATAAVLYGTRQERIIEGVTLCE